MREGSLEAPTRRPIAWDDLDFADRTKTEAEMRRIWDICHTCHRCFNLCDAFPRLFDLIDSSAAGELDSVARPPSRSAGPVARQASRNAKPFLSSECPLAGMHILPGDGDGGQR
jgi:hypothetical protein